MSIYDECERMTTTNRSGKAVLKHPIVCGECKNMENAPYDENGYNVANWISVLEDLLFDKDGNALVKYSRLAELAAAEREGRVVVLPCKVGDTVYVVENKRCGDGSSYVTDFDIYEYPFSLDLFHHLFGRKFYITRQEAEVALSETIRHTEELRAKICGYYFAAGKGETNE